ncbi:MAG: CNNM domain-containing protein [bacterium]|nr:CNNM domain-containing protein [bacterium]
MIEILIFLILLILSAFFAGSETAIFSISRFKLHSLVKEEKAGAAALTRLKSNPNRLLATILVGNNLVNIFIASYATFLATTAFGSLGIGVATGATTVILLILGDSLPKSLAAHRPAGFALFAGPILEIIGYFLYPAVTTLEAISTFFTKNFAAGSAPLVSEEELKSVIAISEEAGLLGADAAEIMENVVEFEDVKVVEVMTPEISVVYLDGNKTLSEVMPTIVKTDYSRFPVFEGDEENIIGVFDIDFALREIQKRSWNTQVKELAVPPFIVPESKKVADLLSDFAKRKKKFALVVDEHGSFSGVASLEDILEEIVGDIFDKSLKVERVVKPLKGGGFRIAGSARVTDLEQILHVNLKGDGFTTLAGLVETQIGRIPKKGEKIRLKHFEIEIEEADERSIHRVRLYRLPAI